MAKTPRFDLTPRERDVVRGVLAGQTNREIASALGLSVQTVKNVLSMVYLKCQFATGSSSRCWLCATTCAPGEQTKWSRTR